MGAVSTGLGQTLFGQTRRRLLGWLLGHPGEAFYLSELKRQTGAGQGALQRELATLTDAGILLRSVRGRHVFFKANASTPIFEELRSILVKTSGVADVLRDALAPLSKGIAVAFVFGSVAEGTERASSDVDLAVIGDVSFGEVVAALSMAQAALGREINPTTFPVKEFRTKFRNGHHFLTSLLHKPKIFVAGDSHEFERLAQVGLDYRAPNQRKRDAGLAERARSRPARQRRAGNQR